MANSLWCFTSAILHILKKYYPRCNTFWKENEEKQQETRYSCLTKQQAKCQEGPVGWPREGTYGGSPKADKASIPDKAASFRDIEATIAQVKGDSYQRLTGGATHTPTPALLSTPHRALASLHSVLLNTHRCSLVGWRTGAGQSAVCFKPGGRSYFS